MSLSENRFALFRDMRAFAHVLIGKPVPTFPGHAGFCACPYRKTGSHFSGTCDARVFDGNGRIGARADGDTSNRGIEAPAPTIFARGRGTAPTPAALSPRGIPAGRRAGRKGAEHDHDERRVFPSPSCDLPAAGEILPGPRGCARLVRHGPGVQGQGGRNGRRSAADAAPRARTKLGRRLRLDHSSLPTLPTRPRQGLVPAGTALQPWGAIWACCRPSGVTPATGRRIHALLTVPTEAANARCRLTFFGADYRFGAGLSLRCGLHATSPPFHNWAILKGGLPGLMRQWDEEMGGSS